jgi:hypothetical protein
MTSRSCLAATVGLALATVACHRSSMAPSAVRPLPSNVPIVARLQVQGPSRLAPGQTTAFTATATLSDNSTQDYTTKVTWRSDVSSVVDIAQDGTAHAGVAGEVIISARAPSCCLGASLPVLVLPPNTYRLTGTVLESGLKLQGATVTVVSGVGVGLTATTDDEGKYRLYGVAGRVDLKMSKEGYADIDKTLTVVQNDVLDFPDAHQLTLPSISGRYVLTLQPDPACATSSDPRVPGLSENMLQPRSYVVDVTQFGPRLRVTGAAPTFMPPSDHFDGSIRPADQIAFTLGDGYGYGPTDGLMAILAPGSVLTYEGVVTAMLSGSAIHGVLDGELQLFSSPYSAAVLGQCRSTSIQFSLTPAPNGTMR